MNNKILFIYNSPYLFKILSEIKKNLNFEIQHIDEKEYKKINFDQLEKYSVVSIGNNNIKNCLVLNNLPEKLTSLVEKINISFIRNQFINQSELKIGKYTFSLEEYIIDKLSRLGICNINSIGINTFKEDHICFSYRKSLEKKENDYGRMISTIVIKG